MTGTEIKKMADMETWYWWHLGKVHLVRSLIKHYCENLIEMNILEIGCGTGGLTEHLCEFGNVTGIDISQEAVDYCKGKGIENVINADIVTFDHKDFPEKFDLILMLDVLEHIQDDVHALIAAKGLLSNTGLLMITVPAHKFLWSEHDEALEHKRRYHKVEVTRKLKDAGFDVVGCSYFVTIVSPLIILYRIWNNVFGKTTYPKTSYVRLPNKINSMLVTFLKAETWVLQKVSLPFGITINIIARKS